MNAAPPQQGERLDPRRLLWLEIGVIAALYFLPGIWSGIQLLLERPFGSHQEPQWLREITDAILHIRKLIPGLFIVWVAGEKLSSFGFCRFNLMRGLAFILASLAAVVMISLLSTMVWPQPHEPGYRRASFETAHLPSLIWFLATMVSYITQEFSQELM